MARLHPCFDEWRLAESAVLVAQRRLLSALVARDWPAVQARQAEVQARLEEARLLFAKAMLEMEHDADLHHHRHYKAGIENARRTADRVDGHAGRW